MQFSSQSVHLDPKSESHNNSAGGVRSGEWSGLMQVMSACQLSAGRKRIWPSSPDFRQPAKQAFPCAHMEKLGRRREGFSYFTKKRKRNKAWNDYDSLLSFPADMGGGVGVGVSQWYYESFPLLPFSRFHIFHFLFYGGAKSSRWLVLRNPFPSIYLMIWRRYVGKEWRNGGLHV